MIAKPGLDGHDRGAKVVALALRDAGIEVIYTGIRSTVESIVNAAIDEDVDVIGLSILSGNHDLLAREIIGKLRKRGGGDIAVVLGGTIPNDDIPRLKEIGISGVFTTESDLSEIVQFIDGLTRRRAGQGRGSSRTAGSTRAVVRLT